MMILLLNIPSECLSPFVDFRLFWFFTSPAPVRVRLLWLSALDTPYDLEKIIGRLNYSGLREIIIFIILLTFSTLTPGLLIKLELLARENFSGP